MHIPDMGGALGLWQHPTQNILYVGFPLAGKVGVYSINASTGALTFQSSTPAGLAACWLRTAQNGNRLYCLNSGENTISMYNTTNAASPVSFGPGKLTLKQSGPDYTVDLMGMMITLKTSEPFAFEFSPTEKFLYVVNQHTNPSFSIGNFNYFHIVNVAGDGTLSEPSEPILLPVQNIYRPQGTAVFRID
jgi:6-phosphogluconolactonase (cycloisomerase 2 family)